LRTAALSFHDLTLCSDAIVPNHVEIFRATAGTAPMPGPGIIRIHPPALPELFRVTEKEAPEPSVSFLGEDFSASL
jgi:hypothetical protein